ncbi:MULTISPECIES: ATP-binding protein [unclassified Amycolatopsis]|uniref:ATP-binding protein n=1 Tax=unclassified Amycolatopsis TaxID=2618356 RepID=UPI002874256B|nr:MULTISPECIES: ATP-binding protein [unclassified Amycolatopsis]MDS0134427.1 ATP-binding protein [Amycolatopsis sp. 505]MDS0147775.1 ATP-binding protein [Amycolatopsis sp. CM201R]
MSHTPVHLTVGRREEATVVQVSGELNLGSYPVLRDGLLKIATDAPDGLVADIGELAIADSSLVSVFSLVAMRIGDWPGIPFAIVADPGQRALLSRHVVDRYVPVRADPVAAVAALDHPVRRRSERTFTRGESTSARIREFVTRRLLEWEVAELAEDARLIATELAENVLRHTTSEPKVRLDLRRGVCTVAVADQDARPAMLLERLSPFEPGMGLKLVAQVARSWGCSRSWAGGKVVWAVLVPSARTTGDRPAG